MKEKMYKFNILFLKIRIDVVNILSLMNIMIFPIYILFRLFVMIVTKEIPVDFLYSEYAFDAYVFVLFLYLHVIAEKMKNIIWSHLFTAIGILFYANLCVRFNMYGDFFNSFFLILAFLVSILTMIENGGAPKPKRIRKTRFTFFAYLGYCIIFLEFGKILNDFFDFEGSLFPSYEAVVGIATLCGVILSNKGYNVKWLFWSVRNILCIYFWHFIDNRLPIDDTYVFLLINSVIELIIYVSSENIRMNKKIHEKTKEKNV